MLELTAPIKKLKNKNRRKGRRKRETGISLKVISLLYAVIDDLSNAIGEEMPSFSTVKMGEILIMSKDYIVFEDKNYRCGFTQLPNVVLTSTVLDPTDKVIYGILLRYATMEHGALPSVPTICLEANISVNTYRRSIKKFIKSATNPKPEVTLITAIQRTGTSNVFKIHRITDRIIAKLKAVVTFSKEQKNDQKRVKKLQKTSKKSAKNETSKPLAPKEYEKHPVQNGGGTPTQNGGGTPTQNDPLIILTTNNIDNNKESNKNVVVVQDEFKEKLQKTITKKQAEGLIQLAVQHEKNVLDCIKETVVYFEQSKKEKKNPYGAVYHAIINGWDVQTEQPKPTSPMYREFDDAYFNELLGGVL